MVCAERLPLATALAAHLYAESCWSELPSMPACLYELSGGKKFLPGNQHAYVFCICSLCWADVACCEQAGPGDSVWAVKLGTADAWRYCVRRSSR